MTACDGVTRTSVTLDHVLPVSAGGTSHITNLVAACLGCNNAKADLIPEGAFKPRRKRRKPTRVAADAGIQAAREARKMAARRELGGQA